MDIDRNLLFAVLAFRANLLDADRFTEGCQRWAVRKSVPLAEVLVERGWLSVDDRTHVDYLVGRNVQLHAGDAREGLKSVADPAVWRALATVKDPEVQDWLDRALPGSALLDPDAEQPKRGWVGVTVLLVGLLLVLGFGGLATLVASLLFAGRHQALAEQARMRAEMAAMEARAQRDLAEVERQRALALVQQQKGTAPGNAAEANFRQAREAVDRFLANVAARQQAEPPGEDQVRRQLLQDAAGFYETFLKEKGNDAAARHEVAKAHLQLGDLHQRLQEPEKARAAYQRALELLDQLTAESPDMPAYRKDRAAVLVRLGKHGEATAALAKLGERPPEALDVACLVARCVPLAEKDRELPEEQRKAVAQKYAARAVELLQQAEAAGQFKQPANRDRLVKDIDLDPLRQQPEFVKLLERVRAEGKE